MRDETRRRILDAMDGWVEVVVRDAVCVEYERPFLAYSFDSVLRMADLMEIRSACNASWSDPGMRSITGPESAMMQGIVHGWTIPQGQAGHAGIWQNHANIEMRHHNPGQSGCPRSVYSAIHEPKTNRV